MLAHRTGAGSAALFRDRLICNNFEDEIRIVSLTVGKDVTTSYIDGAP